MINILFLHGLESPLSDDKRMVLERFGKVFAPDIDYKSDANSIESLYAAYQHRNIDLIIGSSMGGFAGFYLSVLFDVPALLFNPALPYRSVEQRLPEKTFEIKNRIDIVLGALDTLIIAGDTKVFVETNFSNPLITIKLRADLEHRIPLDIFEEEATQFINSL